MCCLKLHPPNTQKLKKYAHVPKALRSCDVHRCGWHPPTSLHDAQDCLCTSKERRRWHTCERDSVRAEHRSNDQNFDRISTNWDDAPTVEVRPNSIDSPTIEVRPRDELTITRAQATILMLNPNIGFTRKCHRSFDLITSILLDSFPASMYHQQASLGQGELHVTKNLITKKTSTKNYK